MEYPDPPDTGPSELNPCGICGRTFRPEALTRHEKVCEKNAAKKRKVFDSSKPRALEDGESRPPPPKQPPKAKAQNKQKAAADEKPKKSNWREKHEELIETIKRARGQDENKNEIQTELKKKVPSDYVQCPACQRHFNQRAAERHIPWCQKKKAETPKSPAEVAEAKEKLFARVKYRPPQGKSRLHQQQQHKPSKTNGAKKPPPEKTPPSTQQQKGSRSSPPNLLDNRNNRANSLDRVNNNVTHPIYRRRSGSRSREKEPASSPDLPLTIIKFKERFPHHISKRNVDLETSLTSEQLRELLTCRRGAADRCPKTVPGVRLSGGHVIRNENDSWNNSWNKRSVSKPPGSLPEVSSSELPGSWAGMNKACWDLDQSMGSTGSSGGSSSSGGSLPPLSRESADDPQVAFCCHQCSSRFPLIAAKYCCECGARRRGYCIPQTV